MKNIFKNVVVINTFTTESILSLSIQSSPSYIKSRWLHIIMSLCLDLVPLINSSLRVSDPRYAVFIYAIDFLFRAGLITSPFLVTSKLFTRQEANHWPMVGMPFIFSFYNNVKLCLVYKLCTCHPLGICRPILPFYCQEIPASLCLIPCSVS